MAQENYGLIAFEGLPNTRDLGGMETADGRRIRRGLLLRSGALGRATATDLRALRDTYRLRLDVDLRTDEECAESPDPVEALPGLRFEHLPVFQDAAAGVTRGSDEMRQLVEGIMRGEIEPAEFMVHLYPHMLLSDMGRAAYTGFFRALLETTEGAALWHCSAGKDRCGMASALVETVLGVPRVAVEADYLATNAVYGVDPSSGRVEDVLNGVDLRFFHAAVEAAEQEFGSLEAYAAQALGVDADARAELRARYLEE